MNAKRMPSWIVIAVMVCVMLLLSAWADRPYRLLTYGADLVESTPFWPCDMLTYEALDTREEGLELDGRIPLLTNEAGNVQARINTVIDQAIAGKIADARESRVRSLTFEFEYYFSAPYMSIILKSTATSASSKTEVVSINFNTNTGRLIRAEDVVGPHVVQLADRLLVEMIRRDPVRYNPSFTGMREDQPFSITDREIAFWFNEFQLASGFEGLVPLTLRLNDIKEITLAREDYRIQGGFNLKMVPVRVVEALGYDITWHEDTMRTSVYHNGELVIKITPGVNNYVREDRFTRSLEAAPDLRDYTTYVPISFFDQILSLVAFSVDEHDNITFASYPVTDSWFYR